MNGEDKPKTNTCRLICICTCVTTTIKIIFYYKKNLMDNFPAKVSSLSNSNSAFTKKACMMTFDPIALRYIGKNVDKTEQCKFTSLGEQFNMCFKLIKSESRLVKSVLFSHGFLQCSSRNQKCNLVWTNTHLSTHTMRQLCSWQRVNHFPRSWMLTRKDQLYESIERASVLYGSEWFTFIPDFFCTPISTYTQQSMRQKFEESHFGLDAKFIVKPADGSLGRGIYFLDNANLNDTLGTDKKLVISRYIDRPYLVNGLKWDLRVYVLVTSFYPLIAYVHSDGLARFAVHKYSEKGDVNDGNVDMNKHLTNYSLNKQSTEFVRNNDCTVENMGHKWTLSALLRELEKRGEDVNLLMVRIEDIVIKSLLSVQSSVAAMCRKLNVHPKCCFELFGFDILVDEQLKPWLLEINLSPSLTCDSPLDSLLKTHLFCNSLNIAQIPIVSESNMLNECSPSGTAFEEDESKNSDRGHSSMGCDQSNATLSAIPSVSSAFSSNSESSSNCESISSTNLNFGLKRKGNGRTPFFVGKMRRLDRIKKVSYSSERVTPQYLERLKCHFDKLKSEEQRLGHFNRIFPRKWTWHLYRTILEDCGQEKWDEALHKRMTHEQWNSKWGDSEPTLKDIELAHEQLMNANSFKRRDQLAPIVHDVLLAEAFSSAECYRRKRFSGDLIPFPSSLPRIRQSARRRTKSQTLAEEVKKIRMEQRRKETATSEVTGHEEQRLANGTAQGNGGTTMGTEGGQGLTKPLSEVNLNVGQKGRTPKVDEQQKDILKATHNC